MFLRSEWSAGSNVAEREPAMWRLWVVSRVVGTALMCSGMKMHGWWTVEPPSAINSFQNFWL